MKKLIVLLLSFLAISCTTTGTPYVKQTLIDPTAGKRTEILCRQKLTRIPYYAVFIFGFFTVNSGEDCIDKTTALTEPSFASLAPDYLKREFEGK